MTKGTGLIHALLLSTLVGTGFGAVWGLIAVWIIDAAQHVIVRRIHQRVAQDSARWNDPRTTQHPRRARDLPGPGR